jgi:hypothetical protein
MQVILPLVTVAYTEKYTKLLIVEKREIIFKKIVQALESQELMSTSYVSHLLAR